MITHAAHDNDAVEACIFCRIIARTEPAEIVYADEHAVAFLDLRPLFHGHTLVVPPRHAVTLGDLAVAEVGPFFERVRQISGLMPPALGSQGTFVANNNVVSQSVAHLHVHVVPRTKGDGLRGFFWPRTSYGPGELEMVGNVLRDAFATVGFDA